MRNSVRITLGVIAFATGYVATILLLGAVGFGRRDDPIMSGLLAALVLAPAGGIACMMLTIRLATRRGIDGAAPSVTHNSVKAALVTALLCAAAIALYCIYAVASAAS